MAHDILAVFHFTEKVFLTGYVSVLPMTFRQPLLKSKTKDYKYKKSYYSGVQ